MSASPNLKLPYIDANQNQKSVTHNEALRALDALVNLRVAATTLTVPPAAPNDGQCWIVGSGATGAWAGKDLNVAAWQDGAWQFYAPNPGFVAYVDALGGALMWTGAAWTSLLGAVSQLQLTALGLGTAPDGANPLAARLNAALLAALPTTGNPAGTGDVRLKLSKQAAGNTATVVFQDAFSGRAEFGLAGDDDFHLKVSADGSTFSDALRVTAATGAATFLAAPSHPTPAAGDASAKSATTAFVGTAVSAGFARTQVADANYAVLGTDRTVAVIAVSAARTLTLPAASAFPQGATLTVVDESGACSATCALTLARTGTDTINGATSAVLSSPYAYVALQSNGAGKWTVIDQSPAAAVPRGYIAGLVLANDGTSPNTVLDIAPGLAADSTGAVTITLPAFTKSTGGSWAAGSGANGMGNGLTVAASTWYHVFAILKGGVADVYFDTSVTAANAPAGTTAFRRLGSIRTSASSQILKFSQNGDEFLWYNVVQDIATSNGFQTAATLYTLSVPPGVKVNALISVTTPTANNNAYVQSPDQSGTQGTAAQVASSAPLWAAINVRTNTASQIQAYSQLANAAFYEITSGWVDTRGK